MLFAIYPLLRSADRWVRTIHRSDLFLRRVSSRDSCDDASNSPPHRIRGRTVRVDAAISRISVSRRCSCVSCLAMLDPHRRRCSPCNFAAMGLWLTPAYGEFGGPMVQLRRQPLGQAQSGEAQGIPQTGIDFADEPKTVYGVPPARSGTTVGSASRRSGPGVAARHRLILRTAVSPEACAAKWHEAVDQCQGGVTQRVDDCPIDFRAMTAFWSRSVVFSVLRLGRPTTTAASRAVRAGSSGSSRSGWSRACRGSTASAAPVPDAWRWRCYLASRCWRPSIPLGTHGVRLGCSRRWNASNG